MPKIIPIVYATENNFANLCSVSIQSIIKNSNVENQYNIYVFYTRLSKDNILKLEKMSKKNIKIECLDISKYLDFNVLYETEEYPIEMYYRLHACEILDYDKIIYLDCDTIVVSDIEELYDIDLKNNPVGMVRDFTYYLEKSKTDYNSGVMIFNSKLYNRLRIKEQCYGLLKKNKYRFPDQTVINLVCKNNIRDLNLKFNHQVSLAFYRKFKNKMRKNKNKELYSQKPVIIHFSYVTKPYNNIYSKYNDDFWKFAKDTPYYNELVNIYLASPYNVLKNSPIEDVYIDMIEEGKIGLSKVLNVFFYSLKYWILFKIYGGIKDGKN